MEMLIEIDEDRCMDLYYSLLSDNDENIFMQCSDGKIEINIKNLKLTSIYNIAEDILRNYEVFSKIKNL